MGEHSVRFRCGSRSSLEYDDGCAVSRPLSLDDLLRKALGRCLFARGRHNFQCHSIAVAQHRHFSCLARFQTGASPRYQLRWRDSALGGFRQSTFYRKIRYVTASINIGTRATSKRCRACCFPYFSLCSARLYNKCQYTRNGAGVALLLIKKPGSLSMGSRDQGIVPANQPWDSNPPAPSWNRLPCSS